MQLERLLSDLRAVASAAEAGLQNSQLSAQGDAALSLKLTASIADALARYFVSTIPDD